MEKGVINGMIKVVMKENGIKIKCMASEHLRLPMVKLFRGFSRKITILEIISKVLVLEDNGFLLYFPNIFSLIVLYVLTKLLL